MQSSDLALAELIPYESIIIGDRFRKEYKNIEELAESIKEHGLMHFPVLDENNNLIAGGRRLQALHLLGWPEVPVSRRKDIPEAKLREMELEENLQREALTWQEEIALKEEIVKLKKSIYGERAPGRAGSGMPGITNKDVAEMLNESPANLSLDLTLAKAMQDIPELADCETKDAARKKLKQIQEKLIVEELERRHKEAQEQRTDADNISFYQLADANFKVGDAFEGLRHTELDNTVKLINVDTPYGIDLNSIKKGDDTGIVESNYLEWAKEDFINKSREVLQECYRISSDDTILIWWFAIQWYQPLVDLFNETGWKYDPVPCLWSSDGNGQTNQPEVYLARCYEPFFVCRKGKPVIMQRGRSNVFNFPRVPAASKIHPTEKPIKLMEEIFKTFASPGCKILVPFLGSGNDILAGFTTQHIVFGFDLNNEVKKRFLIRVAEMSR